MKGLIATAYERDELKDMQAHYRLVYSIAEVAKQVMGLSQLMFYYLQLLPKRTWNKLNSSHAICATSRPLGDADTPWVSSMNDVD